MEKRLYQRIQVKDGEPVEWEIKEEKKQTRKRFRTEEEFNQFKREMLASIDRHYDGFKKAVELEEVKPVPDKLGLLLLHKSGKLRGFCGTREDIQSKAYGSKNKR